MATRAEEFRYQVERSGPKKDKQVARHGRADGTGEAQHNASARAARRATYALEESGGRPSRKSTRKSAHRQKTDVQYRLKHKTSEVAPHAVPR